MVDSSSFGSLDALRSHLRRRQFLRAVGACAAAASVATGGVAAQSGGGTPYDEAVAVGADQVTHATVDPGSLVEPTIPRDPDILDEGEGEEVPRGSPDGGAGPGSTPEPDTGTTGTGLSLLRDFDGFTTRDVVRQIDLDDDGVEADDEIFFAVPSDNQAAAGGSHLVTVINSEIGFIDKAEPDDGDDRGSGPFDDTDYVTHYRLEDFFYDVLSLADGDEDNDGDGAPDALQFENIQVFDPRARYDPGAGRFIVACVEFNLDDTKSGDDGAAEIDDPNDFHGAYLLAVSTSDDPTDPWEIYRIEPADNFGLVDYPTLGYDGGAVYLSQNFFALPGFSFEGATLAVLDKGDLTAGNPTPAGWEFTGLTNPDGSLAFTLQPAAMPESDGLGHLANSRFGNGQTLTGWDVDHGGDLSTAPGLENWSVRTAPYANAPAAEQDDSNKKIDSLDTRLMNLAYDEATGSLWTAHTTAEGYVRWYELDPDARALVQTAGYQRAHWSTFLPTVEAHGGTMVLVYNVSAEQEFAGVEVAGRTASHPDGELQDHEPVQLGEVAYNYDDTQGDVGPGPEENVLRWGDYNGAAVDPDDGSFWVIGQYAKDSQPDQDGPVESELYGTRIANVSFGD